MTMLVFILIVLPLMTSHLLRLRRNAYLVTSGTEAGAFIQEEGTPASRVKLSKKEALFTSFRHPDVDSQLNVTILSAYSCRSSSMRLPRYLYID
ncbi:uncharacterized protein EV420DRAFT_1509943 [Desarmillaria tabescens]|uniref:Secreted protein n=1 Tax=Armillaria tabescens TaxID=1929756 RepID=A0AA39TPK6_ARMTA|nr:uncharacterized protein EV420DRAFT_1509943 [Desarmillaria tabescens]KAK0466122.1 hypothetical protein EV420DRAFT_1509943 [Desarmillaria tabescens]